MLRGQAGVSSAELSAAAVAALLEAQDLKALDDVLAFEKSWNGSEPSIRQAIISEDSSFLFVFTPARLSPQTLRLRSVLFMAKVTSEAGKKGRLAAKALSGVFAAGQAGDRADIILETEPSLAIGEPTIIAFPSREPSRAYFMMVLVSSGDRTGETTEFAGGPPALKKITPVYPEELRRQGLEGQVELQVGVDEAGIVQGVRVRRSLHPYLDHAAVQALKQWEFEPVLQNGRAVPVVITVVVNFSREAYRRMEEAAAAAAAAPAGPDSSPNRKLAMILEKAAAYCQKLTESALDYICEETTHDVLFNFWTKEDMEKSGVTLSMVSRINGSISTLGISFMPFHNIKRTEKNEYTCDYLLVKKGGRIEDRRIVLKENKRTLPDRNKLLEEKRLSTLLPFLAPVRLIGRERQPYFDYRLVKEDRIKGQAAYVIEASPKSGDPGGIEGAKIWLGRDDSRVLKIETAGVPLEGYERVLEEIIGYNLKPRFITTYAYLVEKKGLAFPSSAEIRVDYPGGISRDHYVEKIRTSVRYDDYKFFMVETESTIK
ncbi:MAG: TonB family protein [Candidatus Aminicenantales bacterium]